MTRIGAKPIRLSSGITVEKVDGGLRVKGPKGTLSERLPVEIEVEITKELVTFSRINEAKSTRALHGLVRALVANMVRGVSEPFAKTLEIQGVGYRAEVKGKVLELNVGYSHSVNLEIPKDLTVLVDRNVIVKIEGIDRQKVGQFAADVRGIRPPEPYKGKGIRYIDEHVRRKVGKAGAAA